jgi:hypothetical protein
VVFSQITELSIVECGPKSRNSNSNEASKELEPNLSTPPLIFNKNFLSQPWHLPTLFKFTGILTYMFVLTASHKPLTCASDITHTLQF